MYTAVSSQSQRNHNDPKKVHKVRKETTMAFRKSRIALILDLLLNLIFLPFTALGAFIVGGTLGICSYVKDSASVFKYNWKGSHWL